MMYYRQALMAEARSQIRALQVSVFPYQKSHVRRGLVESYQSILSEEDVLDQDAVNTSWNQLRRRRNLHVV